MITEELTGMRVSAKPRLVQVLKRSCCLWHEVAIQAADIADIVSASRGAHCRPLHPRLASFCSVKRFVLLAEKFFHKTRSKNPT